MENDTRTPKDRISSDFMQKLFELESRNDAAAPETPQENGAEAALATVRCRDLDGLPLAMAYVPMQKWRELYEPEMGFSRGTIFKELDLPFLGDRYDMKKKSEGRLT